MMNLRLILAVLFFSILESACGNANIDLAKKAIEGVLSDPSSVQYKDVKEFSDAVVCGEINAKNKLGGYVGYSKFIYNGRRKSQIDLNITDDEEIMWWCSDRPNKRVIEDLDIFKMETLCNKYKSENDLAMAESSCKIASMLKNKK